MVSASFDFSRALAIIKGGGVVSRLCWQGTGLTIGVVIPEPINEKPNQMTPFLAVRAGNGQLMPWQPSSQEMLSSDWVEVEQGLVGHG